MQRGQFATKIHHWHPYTVSCTASRRCFSSRRGALRCGVPTQIPKQKHRYETQVRNYVNLPFVTLLLPSCLFGSFRFSYRAFAYSCATRAMEPQISAAGLWERMAAWDEELRGEKPSERPQVTYGALF